MSVTRVCSGSAVLSKQLTRSIHQRACLAASPASSSSASSLHQHHTNDHHDHHADHHDGYDSHKLFNPPYDRRVTVGLFLSLVTGACGAVAAAVCYQQYKGGFWFKGKQA